MLAGANPHVRIAIDGLSEIFYKNASENQLKYMSPLGKYEIQKIDARLGIISPYNTRSMTNVDPEKQSMVSVANKEIHKIFLDRAAKKELRWCLTQYPTNASAQDAEMSLEEYEDFMFNAAHVEKKDPISYWKDVYKEQEKIKKILEKKKKLHIIANDTDLKSEFAKARKAGNWQKTMQLKREASERGVRLGL